MSGSSHLLGIKATREIEELRNYVLLFLAIEIEDIARDN
tara:strand:- start:362 stop:478 length:117 start_codon:yes stop_codon:yes gene_type:complete